MKINVMTRQGQEVLVEGSENFSLMEVIRNDGIAELEALCGGQLTCATCHVYVDDDYIGLLPPKDIYEDDMLETSDYMQPNSRLACQIPCSEKLDGIRVVIAPAD